MLAEVKQYMENAGFVDPVTSRVNRGDLAQRIADLLNEPERVVTSDSAEEIAAKALSLDEITAAIFGQTTPELRSFLGALTGSRGAVQNKLEDGTVLCSQRIAKQLGEAEGSTRSVACRFVSNNPETVKQANLWQQRDRAISAAKGLRKSFELSARRVPELETYRKELAATTIEGVSKELTSGTE